MRKCPKCNSTDYNNRQFELLINECGHSLCANCVNAFYARNTAPCYKCGRVLKRNNFWTQTFDDPVVEKDAHWRKKLRKVYNLREEDFADARGYNDYLEEFERVVSNMVNEVDVEQTQEEVKRFASQHQEAIVRNKGKKSADDLWVDRMIDEDKAYRHRVHSEREHSRQEHSKRAAARQSQQQSAAALVAQLAESDTPAAVIVDAAKRLAHSEAEKNKVNGKLGATANDRWPRSGSACLSDNAAGVPFVYTPCTMSLFGPAAPDDGQLWADTYLSHVRAANEVQLAGGFHHVVACKRVLMEAMCALDLLSPADPIP